MYWNHVHETNFDDQIKNQFNIITSPNQQNVSCMDTVHTQEWINLNVKKCFRSLILCDHLNGVYLSTNQVILDKVLKHP